MFTLALLGGCKSSIPDRSGFLSSYDDLRATGTMRLESSVASDLASYGQFVVDPVEINLDARSNASDIQIKLLAQTLRTQVQQALSEHASDGSGQARVRLALTRVRRSAPLLNLHPGTKLTGAGLGEAGIEAEIIDAATGRQLWALAEVHKGDRMEFDAFDEYDDANDAIVYFAKRFHDLVNPVVEDLEKAVR